METPVSARSDEPHRSERGATATEYALLCGFIALVIVAGVTLFGTALAGYYDYMVVTLKTGLHLP